MQYILKLNSKKCNPSDSVAYINSELVSVYSDHVSAFISRIIQFIFWADSDTVLCFTDRKFSQVNINWQFTKLTSPRLYWMPSEQISDWNRNFQLFCCRSFPPWTHPHTSSARLSYARLSSSPLLSHLWFFAAGFFHRLVFPLLSPMNPSFPPSLLHPHLLNMSLTSHTLFPIEGERLHHCLASMPLS